MHSTCIFLSSICFSGVSKGEEAVCHFSQQFLHAAFLLGEAFLLTKSIQSSSEQFFKFFHPQPLHLLLLMSPTSQKHFMPCVHPSTSKTTIKMEGKSHTQTLSLNLSQLHPLWMLFSHLTQSLSCTLGNLLIPPEELCFFPFSFMSV